MEKYIKFGSYPCVIIGENGSGKTTMSAQICNNYKDVQVYYFTNDDEDKIIFENVVKEEHADNCCMKELSVSNIEKIFNMYSFGYRTTKAIIVIDNVDSIIKKSSIESFKVFYNDQYIDEFLAYQSLITEMLKRSRQYEDLLVIMTANKFTSIPGTEFINNIMFLSENDINKIQLCKFISKETKRKIKEEANIFHNFDKSYVFVSNLAHPMDVHICSGYRTIINNSQMKETIDENVLDPILLTIRETIKENFSETIKNSVKDYIKEYIKNNIKDIIKETIEELNEF